MKYHIITLSDPSLQKAKQALAESVQDYTTEGWQLQGGHQLTYIPKSEPQGPLWICSQAVIREDIK